MILYKEILPRNMHGYPRRYLLLFGVTDNDAKILGLCNMVRASDYEKVVNGETAEAWMVM